MDFLNSTSSCKNADSSSSHQQRNNLNKQHSLVNGKTTTSRNNIITGGGGGGDSISNNDNGSCQASKYSDSEKRKKPKTRSSTIPPPNPIYPKDLDAWLENCLKDATAPQLSSSSEFLDYNPSSFNMNKKVPPQPSSMAQGNAMTQGGFHKTDHFLNNPFIINKLLRTSSGLEGDANVEFASLPPTVNLAPCGSAGGGGGGDNQDTQDPSRSFRFSDPCLVTPSENDSKLSGQNTPDQRNFENQIGNNKFLAALLEQLTLLRETNTKIYRNLHETKVELEALKHAPNWGLRHRRDSLSGLSTHSQPMGFVFGASQSPAPTYHSGMYTPGMMSDVVREVKEAARVREDALLNRVKAMVEERSWSIGEGNLRLMRDIEEIKAQIQHLRSDRKESNRRIAQLEAENKYMRSILASILNNRTTEIIHENEIFRSTTPLRKNIQEIPKSSKRGNLNLNYGTVNHEENFTTTMPSPSSVASDRNNIQKSTSLDTIKFEHHHHHQANSTPGRRSPYANSDTQTTTSQNNSFRMDNLYFSPNSEKSSLNTTAATTTTATADEQHHLLQMEKDTLDLRRELQDAIASKKHAENRIIALENMVKRLQIKVTNPTMDNGNNPMMMMMVNGGNNSSGVPANLSQTASTTSSTTTPTTNDKSPNLISISSSQIQGVSPKLSLAGPITDL